MDNGRDDDEGEGRRVWEIRGEYREHSGEQKVDEDDSEELLSLGE